MGIWNKESLWSEPLDNEQLLLVICLSLLSAVVLSSPAPELSCIPGGICQADTIPLDVIDFAKRKLKLSNNGLLKSCAITPAVETFTRQVVAGTIFRFDLKIQNLLGSPETCPTAPETCYMVVFRPLPSAENPNLQVLVGGDDDTRCTREPVKSNMYDDTFS